LQLHGLTGVVAEDQPTGDILSEAEGCIIDHEFEMNKK